MATYSQINPASVLRDALIEAPDDYALDMAFPKIFGMPAGPDGPGGTGVVESRAIDMSGTPGILAGSIVVRNDRDLLGANAAQSVGRAIGSARTQSDTYARATRPFAGKLFDGFAKELIQHVQNGFTAEEEKHLARVASTSCKLAMEKFTVDFFLAKAGEGGRNSDKRGGWTETDWQAGLSGAALGSSNSTLEVLHSAINSLELTGACRPNALYMGRPVMQKLQTDPQVLSRVVTGDASKGVSSVIGMPVAPESHVRSVMAEHLGITELVVGGGIHQNQASGQAASSAYLWDTNRMWLGKAAPVAMSIRSGAEPRVLSGAGSFAAVFTELYKTEIDFEKIVGPQFLECVVETVMDLVSLKPAQGMIIHNLY